MRFYLNIAINNSKTDRVFWMHWGRVDIPDGTPAKAKVKQKLLADLLGSNYKVDLYLTYTTSERVE